MNDFYDIETATDVTARRHRALRDAGRALGTQLVDAAELVRKIRREIHRQGASDERAARLARATQRVVDAQQAIDAHAIKCQRYLPEPEAAKTVRGKRSNA